MRVLILWLLQTNPARRITVIAANKRPKKKKKAHLMCFNHLINNQLERRQQEPRPRASSCRLPLASQQGAGGWRKQLIRGPEAGGETTDSQAPPPPLSIAVVQDRQDPHQPSAMAGGQVLLGPRLALAASRQRRQLVNLPIIAALKGTAQQQRSSSAERCLINIFHRLITATP